MYESANHPLTHVGTKIVAVLLIACDMSTINAERT